MIIQLKAVVHDFAQQYRSEFMGLVTPKVHQMEVHLIDFVERFGNIWANSEEGIESAHKWVNRIRSTAAHMPGIKNKLNCFLRKWNLFQSEDLKQTAQSLNEEGRSIKKHKRPNRKKKSEDLKSDQFRFEP